MSNRIPELETIEFKGASSIAEYSRAGRRIGRDLAAEFDQAAEEISAVLSRQKGHPLLLGVDVRLRARRVAKRLQRAAELANGLAVECVKFNTEFRVQFADVIAPKKQKAKSFDFNS